MEMDIPKEIVVQKTQDSSSPSVGAIVQKDVPIEVNVIIIDKEVVMDEGDMELTSITSSDSDIDTAESCSPNQVSKGSVKTVICGNDADLQIEAEVEAELAMFSEFEENDNREIPLAKMSKSTCSSGASGFNLRVHSAPGVCQYSDIDLGPNIDRGIRKTYTPSLYRVDNDLNMLRQLTKSESRRDLYQGNAASSSSSSRVARAPTPAELKSAYSVGVQVNNPETGNFVMDDPEYDYIHCMMCVVIVTCLITGLSAASVMILNTFFKHW